MWRSNQRRMPPIGVPSNAMSMLVWYSASYTCWSRRFSMIVLRRGVGSESRNVQTERPAGAPTCGRLSPSTMSARIEPRVKSAATRRSQMRLRVGQDGDLDREQP